MTDEFGNWLAGFVDGEGCFKVERALHHRKHYYTYRPGFAIALRSDDRPLLERIHSELGVGYLYTYNRETTTTNRYSFFTVQGAAQCQVIVDVFTRYPLRSKKASDFHIFARAVEVAHGYRRGGGKNVWAHNAILREQMEKLYQELTENRRYKHGGL